MLVLSFLPLGNHIAPGSQSPPDGNTYTLALSPGDWAEYEVRKVRGGLTVGGREVSVGDRVKYVIVDKYIGEIGSLSMELPIFDVYINGELAGQYRGLGGEAVPPVFFPASDAFWEEFLEELVASIGNDSPFDISYAIEIGDALTEVRVEIEIREMCCEVPVFEIQLCYQVHRATGIAVNFTHIERSISGPERILTLILVGSSRPEAVDLDGPSIWGIRVSPEEPGPNDEVLVEARIEDPSGVEKALLSYGGDGKWENITMSKRPDGLYRAVIPPQPHGSIVRFRIYAEDKRGNWAVSEERSYRVRETSSYMVEPPTSHMVEPTRAHDRAMGLVLGGAIAIALAVLLVAKRLKHR